MMRTIGDSVRLAIQNPRLATLVSLAVIALVLLVVRVLPDRSPDVTNAAEPRAAQHDTARTAAQADPAPLRGPSGIDWPQAIARDPFAPLANATLPTVSTAMDSAPSEPDPAQRLHLNAIVFGDSPVALINGHLLHVSESIDGFRISRIERRQVTLEKGGVEYQLHLQQGGSHE